MIRSRRTINYIALLFACNLLIGCRDNGSEDEPVEIVITVEGADCPPDDLIIENITVTSGLRGTAVVVVVKADVKCGEDPLEGVRLRLAFGGISLISHTAMTGPSDGAGKIDHEMRMRRFGFDTPDDVTALPGREFVATVNDSQGTEIFSETITVQ